MFNWVKKLFGTESAVQDKYHAETVVAPKTAEAITPPPAPKAKPAAKKTAPKKAAPKKTAQAKPAAKAAKHTKASLGKLTKAEIDALAKLELGIDLDRRKTKDDMIKDFLAAQKK